MTSISKTRMPLAATLGNIPESERFTDAASAIVAMIPKLGDDNSYSDVERADRNCEILHDALKAVCRGLDKLQARGVRLRWGDGVIRKTVPVISLYNADIVERSKVLLIKSGYCGLCHVQARERQDPDATCTPRTTFDMRRFYEGVQFVDLIEIISILS